MNLNELYESLCTVDLKPRFLVRQVAILNRKKVTKRDPYDVLFSVLAYLYCVEKRPDFVNLFNQFIESSIYFHFEQDADLWSYVEKSILMNADLTTQRTHIDLIREKGFVEARLEGRMFDLHSGNLESELQQEHVPKGTILRRYRALVGECLAIVLLKGSNQEIASHLDRYKKLHAAAVDNYYSQPAKFIESLKLVADRLH